MQVIVSAFRGAFALAVSFIFIDDSRASALQVESGGGEVVMNATVEAIDAVRQLVTVVGPDGRVLTVRVGPEHINVIQEKARVTVRYAEEVAVALRRYAGPPKTDGRGFVDRAEADMNLDAPTVAEQDWVETTPTGVVDHKTVEVSDTVKSVNRRLRLITFAGTRGRTRTIMVPPTVPGFEDIEPGDRVIVLVTRAVAVDIKPL
ncbi:MAG: hypothetical protein ACOYB4_00530 [Methyloceanibacter sp.]